MSKTLYLKAEQGDIGEYVIFSGDPMRVERIINKLDSVEKISVSREFHTYSGFYKDIKITITSTGIGAPSATIALEEMYACGMKVAVRLGTIMGLKADMLGKLVIPVGAMGKDGTRSTYVDAEYPAIADFELLSCMNESAKLNGLAYDNGIICSYDGYYSQMKQSKLSERLNISVTDNIEKLKNMNICGLDMESGAVLAISRLMGIKACSVTLTTVLENLIAEMDSGERKKVEENDLIQVVLDGIYIYNTRMKNEK